jgi:hypothetical protein
MITFRFYLVTLVAIFLSVALGVVIGSTFLEPALVQDLNNQVDGVRQSLDERVERIDALNAEIDDLEAYLEQSAPFAVDGRLAGTEVLITAEEGVDDGALQRLVGRMRQAGATTEGIVWLSPTWGTGDETADVLAALGITDVDPSDVESIRQATWEIVIDEAERAAGVTTSEVTSPDDTTPETTADTPDDTTDTNEDPDATDTDGDGTSTTSTTVQTAATTTTAPAPPLFESDALAVLADAGWLRVEAIDAPEIAVPTVEPEVPAPAFAVVLATGPASETVDPAAGVVELARHQASRGIATLVAEAWAEVDGEDGEVLGERGTHVSPVRDDPELSTVVSTVDDLELIQGQVATALALEDLAAGVAGHYGYGKGAELVLPQWLGP